MVVGDDQPTFLGREVGCTTSDGSQWNEQEEFREPGTGAQILTRDQWTQTPQSAGRVRGGGEVCAPGSVSPLRTGNTQDQSKMKLFPGILTICALVTEVRPLTCNQCSAPSSSCKLQKTTCPSRTTTCSTISTTEIYNGVTNKRIRNSCGQCSDPIAFNTGVVFISQSSSCCRTDLCNNQKVAEPVNSTQNGLKCRGCFNILSDSCRDSEQTVKCVGAETRCMSASGKVVLPFGVSNFIAKGCVSEQVCRSLDILSSFRIQFTQLPACCAGNLCNGDPGRGTSTLEPGVITSGPVTTESSSRTTTNSTGVITSSPVTSETSSSGPTNSKGRLRFIIGVAVGVTCAVLIAMGFCYCQYKKKKDSSPI
ncbi:phospholipase A2 inhibitor and Ly6/PLAUR domain-containing protein-like isoform X2 [Cetorhinus maximus]